jgi:hypothetical protein
VLGFAPDDNPAIARDIQVRPHATSKKNINWKADATVTSSTLTNRTLTSKITPRLTISATCCDVLSRLMLSPNESNSNAPDQNQSVVDENSPLAQTPALTALFRERDWIEFGSLAAMHHVVVRAFPRLQALLLRAGQQDSVTYLAAALKQERARITHAMSFLMPVCQSLASAGNILVIKSLDHWPDLGSDLDLYTDAAPAHVIAIMRDALHARAEKRSWGDRLANKWNFSIPGLPELVEIHIGRLGQMGEQRIVGESVIARAVPLKLGAYTFHVPAPEDRIMISALQRMFRHFYIRLCDVAEISQLIASRTLDYEYLRSLGEVTGLWDGMATYLNIIVEYAGKYGRRLSLPAFVASAARFGAAHVQFRNNFLRIPIMPESAKLYAAELGKLFVSGELAGTLRLSLMPALATAAALKQKVAGSDSGIW